VGEGADVALVFLRRKKYNCGIGARNAKLYPALFAHGLVGEYVETQFFGVKGESAVLVADWNAAELYSPDHFFSFFSRAR
jgi:hypothetical protein